MEDHGRRIDHTWDPSRPGIYRPGESEPLVTSESFGALKPLKPVGAIPDIIELDLQSLDRQLKFNRLVISMLRDILEVPEGQDILIHARELKHRLAQLESNNE